MKLKEKFKKEICSICEIGCEDVVKCMIYLHYWKNELRKIKRNLLNNLDKEKIKDIQCQE